MKLVNILDLIKFLEKKNRLLLFLSVITGIILFFIELFLAYSLQAFIHHIVHDGEGKVHFILSEYFLLKSFSGAFGAVVLFGLLRGVLRASQYVINGVFKESVILYIRKIVLTEIYFSKNVSSLQGNSYLNEKANSAASSVAGFQNFITQFATILLFLMAMFYFSFIGTFIILILLVLLAYPVRKLDHIINSIGIKLNDEWDRVNSKILISSKNKLLLHIYGSTHKEFQFILNKLELYFFHFLYYFKISAVKFALPQTLGVVSVCLITWIVYFDNKSSAHFIFAYFYLFIRFIEMSSSLSKVKSNFLLYWPQFEKIIELKKFNNFNSQADVKYKNDEHLTIQNAIGWEINDLCFRYSDEKKLLFDKLNIKINPHDIVAIIGPSGSGKSTLIKLLLGVESPLSGSINAWVDKKLYSVRERLVLENIAYVGPDPFIFEGTIYENLFYELKKTPSTDELNFAIRLSNCNFIYELPGGINYSLTDQGEGLSDGQKQRISICRAILRHPKALLLDEATSFLDEENERMIINSLKALNEKMTVIIATHKKAVIDFAKIKIQL